MLRTKKLVACEAIKHFFLIIKNPGLQFEELSVFQDWFKKMIRLFCDATFTFSDAHATDLCSVTWVWSPPFGFLRDETGLNVCSKCADEKLNPYLLRRLQSLLSCFEG